MQNDLKLLDEALEVLKEGFVDFPDTLNAENKTVIQSTLKQVAKRLQNNYPYFQTNYAGQMLKPPHAIARLAYMLALYINPNNHALDGSKASSPMEKECVAKIAEMFGWNSGLGHLTSGGTMANLEALWVAGQCHPGKLIVSSELAHYTHERISGVLGLPYQKIKADQFGRMDLWALEQTLKSNRIGTVVVTLGTTGVGSLDPLVEIVKLQATYDFRIHIDAAYGGYFILSSNLSQSANLNFQAIVNADSLVIDPHKHGLQPYGCGCVLFKDQKIGRFYKHDSPYTYFSSEELHLGEISLECSRAGASAVALWATMEMLPLTTKGQFSATLNNCHQAAMKLFDKIKMDQTFITLLEPEIDIVVWGVRSTSLSEMSAKAKKIFHKAAKRNVHLALIQYPVDLLPDHWRDIDIDQDQVTCLRSCLMKTEHLEYVDKLWRHVVEISKLIANE